MDGRLQLPCCMHAACCESGSEFLHDPHTYSEPTASCSASSSEVIHNSDANQAVWFALLQVEMLSTTPALITHAVF